MYPELTEIQVNLKTLKALFDDLFERQWKWKSNIFFRSRTDFLATCFSQVTLYLYRCTAVHWHQFITLLLKAIYILDQNNLHFGPKLTSNLVTCVLVHVGFNRKFEDSPPLTIVDYKALNMHKNNTNWTVKFVIKLVLSSFFLSTTPWNSC